jgi:hypothetical protein
MALVGECRFAEVLEGSPVASSPCSLALRFPGGTEENDEKTENSRYSAEVSNLHRKKR